MTSKTLSELSFIHMKKYTSPFFLKHSYVTGPPIEFVMNGNTAKKVAVSEVKKVFFGDFLSNSKQVEKAIEFLFDGALEFNKYVL